MITKPTPEQLNAIDLSQLETFLAPQRINEGFFSRPAGVEHYRLLAWISGLFNNVTITEIGTLDGMGLTALCHNPTNKVVSWDIKDCAWKGSVPPNGERKIVYEGYFDEVLKSPIIFYDGAHEGKDEEEFIGMLVASGWKGVLVLDDIHLNKEMEKLWADCLGDYFNFPGTFKKEDWTDIGHACGTGIIFFE